MKRITRWRSQASTRLQLSQTAWQECALLGQQEIDLEHLFLATMEDEGVARTLARHGVSREGTRRAVEDMVREDVASLGVDLGSVPITARRSAGDLHHAAVGDLDLAERARALIGRASSPAEALLAVLDEPSLVGPRLLVAQGADPAAVRHDVAALAATPTAATPTSVDLDALPDLHLVAELEPLLVSSRSRFVAAPWRAVWAAISTPEGTLPWLLAAEGSRVDEAGDLVGRVTGRRGTWEVRRSLISAEPPTHQRPGYAVWQERMTRLTGGGAVGWDQGRVTRWFHVTVTPAGDGTQITLVQGSTVNGRLGRLVSPLARVMAPLGLRNALYQLGVTLEEPTTFDD
ncbi:Clp protease N-terminal domain-containing protein [Ornithinimicrobium sp. Y1847]|uniref:Clp protease N-terminal domain-containing protein n=1 Tax=Ornithinimicrobium sp. Y1847 TaxID=3405419 RepID=UPI003B682AB1